TKELNVDEDEHMFDLSDLAGIEVVLQEESTELVEDEGSAKKGVSVVEDKDKLDEEAMLEREREDEASNAALIEE
ncbi:hypothetical protein Tco_0035521, partial [Tanacetum coccineum]